jgi:hypothetical protein
MARYRATAQQLRNTALVCLKSTIFASCGMLAQLMDSCGHERIVRRRCQIWEEYRATSLCQLSGSPSEDTLCWERPGCACGNMEVHCLRNIVVWSWWVHVRSVVDTVKLRWVFLSTLVWFPPQNHSSIYPYSLTHLSLMPHNISTWQHHYVTHLHWSSLHSCSYDTW